MMILRMKRGVLVCGSLILVVLLSGCGEKEGKVPPEDVVDIAVGGGQPAPSYGDAIIIGSIGDISGLIPNITSDSASRDIGSYIYNGLLRYDRNLELEGVLAESWDIENGGLNIVFHLRKGVKWHDGEPFTSEDVLFTYQLMINPNTPTAYAEDYLQVKKATAPDPHTFIVEYEKPFAPALGSWGLSILPKHILENEKDLVKSNQNKHPVGTGSYRFVEWKPGESVVLDSNHDYLEGRPYINRVIYRVIPDQATMFLELKAGGVDYMGLTPPQFTRQTETGQFKKNFNKFRYLSFGYTYLGYNLTNPLFKDKRVRQALSHAIKRKDIIKGVLFGLGVEATGPYKPGTWMHNPGVKTYPYDPELSKKILAEAGWVDTDGDGILDRDGRKFSFTIMTNHGNEARRKTAVIIQRFFKDVGVEVDIREIEWAAFINEFIDKRKFEAVILGWSTGPEPDQYDIWHSSKTGEKELNFISFKNGEVDELLEKGRRVFDIEERKKHYWRFQEILAEEQPYNFLYVAEALPAVQKRFRGIEPAPAGITYNFIEWYVPKGEVKYTNF